MTAARTLDLPLSAPSLPQVLDEGRYQEAGQSFFPRVLGVENGTVRFELVDPATLGRPSGFAVWSQAVRGISLTATATPCLAVLLYGLAAHLPLRLGVAIASVLGALVLQVSVNLWNDVEDHKRLIDGPGSLGGAGVIQKGWLSAREVRRVAWLCLVVGGLLGVPALVLNPVPMLVIGAIALLGTAGYSGKPFGLKYRALGDLAVAVMCGPGLTLGFAWAAFGTVDVVIGALGVFFGAAAVGILHTNNLQDIDVDRARHAVTVASVLGVPASKAYLVFLYVLTYASWVYGWSQTSLSIVALLTPLLALPPLLGLLSKVLRATDLQAKGLELIRINAAQVHLLLGVTLCIGLGVALALS